MIKDAFEVRKCHKCREKSLIKTHDSHGNIIEVCKYCDYELWSPEKLDFELEKERNSSLKDNK